MQFYCQTVGTARIHNKWAIIILKTTYPFMPTAHPSKLMLLAPRVFLLLPLMVILNIFPGMAQALAILPANPNLPPATVQTPYMQRFDVDTLVPAGTSVQILSLSALPPGLQLQNGLLSGAPVQQGTSKITLILLLNNSVSNAPLKTYNLTVGGVSTSSLKNTQIGVPFLQNLTLAGGVPPFKWSSSSLPSWLKIDMGLLSGVPDKVGNLSFSTSVIDSNNNTLNQTWTLVTEPNRFVLIPNIVTTFASTPQQVPLIAMNGSFPYTFVLNNPPQWASIDSNNLDINQSLQGNYSLGVFVTDSTNLTNLVNISVSVRDNLENLRSYITGVTSSFIDSKTGSKVTIFNIPPIDLVPGFDVQKKALPVFNYSSDSFIVSQSSTNTMSSLRTVKISSFTSNLPCPKKDTLIEGTGSVYLTDYTASTITLSNKVVLCFTSCTSQVFRGQRQTFSYGDLVSYKGVVSSETFSLQSITNTS